MIGELLLSAAIASVTIGLVVALALHLIAHGLNAMYDAWIGA